MKGVFSAVRLSFRAVMRSKIRSALTILGILIGVAAVVVVVALGNAVRDKVMNEISTFGANSIFIMPQDNRSSGVKDSTRTHLTEEDATAIAREATSVSDVTPMSGTRAQLVVGDKNASTQVFGVEDPYFAVMNEVVDRGFTFSPIEIRTKANVVILGETVRDELFGSAEAVGAYVRVGAYPFRVVGILKAKGQSPFGEDQDDLVVLPIGTFRTRIMPSSEDRVQMIIASASDEQTVDRATKQIDEILRQRHNLTADQQADFQVRTQDDIRQKTGAIFGALTALLSAVAAISLLVGGIGVMNIMLVSVTQRTREIGVRMAIGAREGDILIQFLVEAVTLSLLGGVAGLVAGIAFIALIAHITEWSMSVPPSAVATAFVTSASIGVIFGFLPARRAARLDPIEALRHE